MNAKFGKWIGGGIGWALGGPLGGLLGYLMGAAFDNLTTTYTSENAPTNNVKQTQRGDFMVSLAVLSAAIIKADRKVRQSELDYVKQFYINSFGYEIGIDGFNMLNDILHQQIQVNDVARQVGQMLDHATKMQMLHYLFGIANADNEVHPLEIAAIEHVSQLMGISSVDFESVKSMFVRNTDSAYKVLGIEPTATNDEIKRAYRKMAVENHPDKVAYLGEDVQRAAKAKFQKINEAYETIKKERGFV